LVAGPGCCRPLVIHKVLMLSRRPRRGGPAGGVPIRVALIGHPRTRKVGGRAAPPQLAVGSSRARGWGKGRRSGHCLGPRAGEIRCFGWVWMGQFGRRAGGRWRPICPAFLLGGLALR
jgi:hypothetical protein